MGIGGYFLLKSMKALDANRVKVVKQFAQSLWPASLGAGGIVWHCKPECTKGLVSTLHLDLYSITRFLQANEVASSLHNP